MITIEGDYIIFSSGKKVYADEGVVGIDNEGNLTGGYDETFTPLHLTDQEKWELSRFMIERWMKVRDALWGRHEDTMKREEPVETYTTKSNTEDLVKVGEEITKLNEALCDRTTCGFHRESPSIQGHCVKGLDGRNCPDLGRAKEDEVLPVGIRENATWPARLDAPRCRCNAVPVEEITDGPKCHNTLCLSYEEMMKDGCELPIEERDQCGTWQAIVAARGKEEGLKIDRVLSESVRYSERGAQDLLRQAVSCPTCQTETIIGLNEEGPDCWKVVEPRYCPACGWKEGQDIAPPKELAPPKSRDLPTFMLGNFKIGPKAKRIHQLAKEYHRRCDDYANLVCTGMNENTCTPMPTNDVERMKLGINAKEALAVIEEKGRLAGISSSEIMKAIQEVRR